MQLQDPRRPGGKDLHRKWMECLNENSNWQHGNSQPTIPFFGTWEGGTAPYFLACWYRGYVSAPGVCLFFVEKWKRLMAVLVHASWLLSYWVFDMFTSMSGKFHRHPWQSMLHLHPLEDPATLIGSLIYTPWKFNISASKVAIYLRVKLKHIRNIIFGRLRSPNTQQKMVNFKAVYTFQLIFPNYTPPHPFSKMPWYSRP